MSVADVSPLTPVLLPRPTRPSLRLSRKSCLLCNSAIKPLFKLPKDYENQLLWLKSIGKENLLQIMTHTYIYNNGKLCGLHFEEKHFTSTLKQKLYKFAVPCRLENKNQPSPAESSDCSFENSLSLPESVCESVKKTNFPSPQIEKNSRVLSSSMTKPASLNKVFEKQPFITVESSSKTGATLMNKVSEKDSVIPSVLSSRTDATSLNKISEKDPLIIDVSSHTTSLNEVSEKTPEMCRAMTNLTAPEMVKDPAVTVITLCCTDRKEGIAFHKFLQDPKQRMRWISAVRCTNTKPTHISVLCPKHFNEEQTNHPSALKENTVPNVFALDILSQQKDVRCFQKWKEATPVDHGGISVKDGFFELHHNPKEIDKFYVKVMYDESVSKIAKRLHSSQTGEITTDVNARKKLKRGKICSPSDLSNLTNIRMHSPQKAGKDFVNHVDVEEELKKNVVCSSSDINSNNLSNLKCLQQTPTEELVNRVLSNNSQENTIDSPSDTNFSDPPDLPVHSPQTNGKETVSHVDVREILKRDTIDSPSGTNFSVPPDLPIHLPQTNVQETASHVDLRENLKKDTICSSSDAIASTRPIFPKHLSRRARKKLVMYANSNNKFRKTLVYPPRNIENEILMYSLSNSGVKRKGSKNNGGQNSLSVSESEKKLDAVSSSGGNERTYCTTGTVTKGRESTDTSTKTVSAEVTDQNDFIDDIVEGRIDSNNSRKKLEKQAVCSPNTKNEKLGHSLNNSGVKRIGQNSLSVASNKDKVDAVSSSSGNERTYCTTGTLTERRDLTDFSTQTDSAEVIDSNNSHIDTKMPKIVDVKGGIDPFSLLAITEMKKIIKLPNEWWGITCTPKYVICSKWNEGYDPVFRVVIEKDYNVKIFIKGRECTNDNRKVSLENISALLQEVDSYEICAGVSDKTMTNCTGHLENEPGKPFSIWCKGCQRKGKELMNRYKTLQKL